MPKADLYCVLSYCVLEGPDCWNNFKTDDFAVCLVVVGLITWGVANFCVASQTPLTWRGYISHVGCGCDELKMSGGRVTCTSCVVYTSLADHVVSSISRCLILQEPCVGSVRVCESDSAAVIVLGVLLCSTCLLLFDSPPCQTDQTAAHSFVVDIVLGG